MCSVEEYLDKTKTYLKDIIDNPKKSAKWKIQSIIACNAYKKVIIWKS